ncbi:MAG: hypothetical protein U1E16_14840 [Hyphomicrobiales bacterium]
MSERAVGAKIYQFPKQKAITSAGTERSTVSPTVREVPPEAQSRSIASVNEIYPELSSTAPELFAALSLLSSICERFDESAEQLEEGNLLLSDDLVSKAILDFPKIFPLIAEHSGPAQFCSSAFHALLNKRGQPLSMEELLEIRSALRTFQREPFMSHDRVLDLLEKLDDCGFDLTPRFLTSVFDELAHESFY